METVGDALPREMARVRDQLMPAYVEISAAGAIALWLMRRDLDRAAAAMAAGDLAEMILALEALRGWKA